jgi:hypothetical protein
VDEFDEALDEFIEEWLEDEPKSLIIAALAAKLDELMNDPET